MASRSIPITVALCLLALCVGAQAAGLYSASSQVIQLTKKDFVDQVFNSPHIWMVEFYAPWCGHCKSLTPAWEAAAKNLNGIVKIAAVNCDEERDLASMFEVKGFPTLLYFGSETSPNPHQKGIPWKTPEPYQGQRTAGAIANYAISRLPNLVVTKKVDEFLAKEPLNKVVLFTDKTKTTNLYKALALEYKDRLAFTEVRNTNEKLVEDFGVTKFPSFVVVEGENRHAFEGKVSRDALVAFFDKYAPPAKTGKSSQKAGKAAEPEPTGPVQLVEVNDAAAFKKECLDRGGPSVIALFDPSAEETDAYKALLVEAGEKYKKHFRFLSVDGPANTHFAQQLRVDTSFPQLVVLNPKKKVMASLIGRFDKEGITRFFDKVLVSSRRLIQHLDELPSFAPEQ